MPTNRRPGWRQFRPAAGKTGVNDERAERGEGASFACQDQDVGGGALAEPVPGWQPDALAEAGYHGCRHDGQQLVVESQDLRPVRGGAATGIAVHGVDRRLKLVRTGKVAPQAGAHDLKTHVELSTASRATRAATRRVAWRARAAGSAAITASRCPPSGRSMSSTRCSRPGDEADDRRRIASRAGSVGHDWAFERQLLRPLPAEPFDTALTLTPRVDRYAQVMVRCNQYSAPARLIVHRVRVKLSASAVTVYDKTTVVARHQRAAGKGVKVLDLDHYLEILAPKPGALPGATALVQARAAGTFTPAHEALWAAARKALGDGPGTRALIEVLLLHRHLSHADVTAGITAALAVGLVSPDVVAVEAGTPVTLAAASAARARITPCHCGRKGARSRQSRIWRCCDHGPR